jgi:hypothetical protein
MTCTTTIPAPDGVGALAFITGDRHLAVGTKGGALHVLDIVAQTTLESHEDAHEKQVELRCVMIGGQSEFADYWLASIARWSLCGERVA